MGLAVLAAAPVAARRTLSGRLLAVALNGQLLAPGGELLAQLPVPVRPSVPGRVEVLLGLQDLLYFELADPLLDSLEPTGGFVPGLAGRGTLALASTASVPSGSFSRMMPSSSSSN